MLLAAPAAFSEGTQTWKQSSYDDFAKGTAKGVALRSDGTIELAPSFRQLYVTPSTYIWAIAADREGNVFAAAGSPSRVYRVSLSGQATVVFQPQELQVQALIAAPDGTLYAATSPDGKVYRIQRRMPEPAPRGKKGEAKAEPKDAARETKTEAPPAAEKPPQGPNENTENARVPVDPDYTSSLFFDPKTKYIWALALDREGRLYVATGDHGEIFRVEKNGTGSVFFKSDEAHIRAMQFDPRGNLIAGTDGSGLVYRISPTGEAFVLYSAPKKEITALAVDPEGNIYAAGVGEKRAQSSAPPVIPMVNQPPAAQPVGPGISITTIAPQTVPGAPPQISAGGGANSSEVYSIAPDGAPRRIWSPQDVVYALAFDSRGRLIAGTGNRGHIFAITPNGDYTDLAKATASQVTSFAVGAGGNLFAATSNLGKIFMIGSAPEAEGTYESDVYDARIFSKWGRAEVRGTGSFELYAHSGNVDNPDRNWSPWRRVDLQHDGPLDVPAARFVQWRVVLHPGTQPTTIDSVALNYRAKNVAPVVDDVYVQVGARYNAMPKQSGDNAPITVGPPQGSQPRFDQPTPAAVRDRDSIAVRWNAHDENDDQLLYSVYFRGDNETEWKLLKDKLSDRFYSWEAGLMPDGGYTLRVVASDAPSHSPDEALSAMKESARFEVDHTPPIVQALNARMENGVVHVTFRAEDGFSPIKRAEYSVDAGDWQFVEPVGQISDARLENYDFNTGMPATPTVQAPPASRGGGNGAVEKTGSEHVVMIRVWDRYDNMGTAKLVVK